MVGILLGLAVVVVTEAFLFGADKVTGDNGTAGLAASTADHAAAVPAIVADDNPAYKPAADQAPFLVGTTVVVTAVCAPFLTVWWACQVGAGAGGAGAPAGAPEPGAAVDPAADPAAQAAQRA